MILPGPPRLHDHPLWQRLHLDASLFAALMALLMIGLVILISASAQNAALLERQALHLFLANGVLLSIAQLPPRYFQMATPWLYGVGLVLLFAVLLGGEIGKGAQRWLNIAGFRFQPSELMKLAVPMMLAWYFNDKLLPPRFSVLFTAILLVLLPVLLIAKQPDLGTALLIGSAGGFVLFLSGMSGRLISAYIGGCAAIAPALWYFLHDYQRQRILTFLSPESDPLGNGYHIIQSKIAIGSGGVYGKGWMNGTQSQLQFLPERWTDFIFAVLGEEFGLIGVLTLLSVYVFILLRAVQISVQAQDTFTRLLAGSITLTFFVYLFVNIGMVSGLLPVVGIPLPLVSYGGTSMVTLMAGLGMLMSIHTHRKLLAT